MNTTQAQTETQEKVSFLRKRISQTEGVIEMFKNKPKTYTHDDTHCGYYLNEKISLLKTLEKELDVEMAKEDYDPLQDEFVREIMYRKGISGSIYSEAEKEIAKISEAEADAQSKIHQAMNVVEKIEKEIARLKEESAMKNHPRIVDLEAEIKYLIQTVVPKQKEIRSQLQAKISELRY